jgi:hypothetical protein
MPPIAMPAMAPALRLGFPAAGAGVVDILLLDGVVMLMVLSDVEICELVVGRKSGVPAGDKTISEGNVA